MHKIKRNTRGSAMLITLLVFMLAALSGTTALTMAASNAGRYTHEKEDQQAYLSVVSAGNLILDRLKGLTIEYAGDTPDKVPMPTDNITLNYIGTGKQDIFLADEGFKNNLTQFSFTTSWEPMDFYLEADNGMGKVCVSVDAAGALFSFRLYHISDHESDSARNYQMTLDVPAEFVEDRYTPETDNIFKRHLKFNTESARFIVEKNVSSEETGGTGE